MVVLAVTTLFRKAMKQYKTAVKKHGQAIIVDPYEEVRNLLMCLERSDFLK